MTPMNNTNVLPIYGSIDEQNARRWWVYGKVYPLYAKKGILPPFQIVRDHIGKQATPNNVYYGHLEYDNPGVIEDGSDDPVLEYDVQAGDKLYYRNLSNVEGSRLKLQYLDGGDNIIKQLGEVAPKDGYIEITTDGEVYVQGLWDEENPYIFFDSEEEYKDAGVNLRGLNGNLITSKSGVLSIIRDGDKDYLVSNPSSYWFSAITEGCFYLEISDDFNIWYSDVFVWKDDLSGMLALRWWDDEDFVMDSGKILYNIPGRYTNEIYLPSDIAKPEYIFNEEGENRDGHFFPAKMISGKRYRFSFWAPEYLLDVLRFVRMADHVIIVYKGKEFQPETFLITPEWQAEGDLAAVDAEFDTDTIAKKINFVQ